MDPAVSPQWILLDHVPRQTPANPAPQRLDRLGAARGVEDPREDPPGAGQACVELCAGEAMAVAGRHGGPPVTHRRRPDPRPNPHHRGHPRPRRPRHRRRRRRIAPPAHPRPQRQLPAHRTATRTTPPTENPVGSGPFRCLYPCLPVRIHYVGLARRYSDCRVCSSSPRSPPRGFGRFQNNL